VGLTKKQKHDVNTTTQIAPSTNTTSSLSGNSDPVNILLSNSIREVNVPSTSSTLFKLYANSGRLAKDRSVYNTDKRGGTGTNIDDGTVVTDTINMNLENMSINFRCKLRGSIFDITGNKRFNKAQITKDLAEFVFGSTAYSSLMYVLDSIYLLLTGATLVTIYYSPLAKEFN
jgi:hypothetical protein